MRDRRLRGLSPREAQIAVMVAAGRNNTEIARELGIAVGTVKGILGAAFVKLGVGDRTQVAAELEKLREVHLL